MIMNEVIETIETTADSILIETIETTADAIPSITNYDLYTFETSACNSIIFAIMILTGVLIGLAFWIHFK